MRLQLSPLQIGNILAFLFGITLNGVSNLPSKPFGGQTNGKFSIENINHSSYTIESFFRRNRVYFIHPHH